MNESKGVNLKGVQQEFNRRPSKDGTNRIGLMPRATSSSEF